MSGSEQRPFRTLIWNSGEGRFELAVHVDQSVLLLPDGQIVELSNADWTALSEAVQMVVPKPKGLTTKPLKPKREKSSAPNQGSRWTMEEDENLLGLWREGRATIEDLMQRFGRGSGGITSRLVRLGASPDREDIRLESKRRAEAASGGSGPA